MRKYFVFEAVLVTNLFISIVVLARQDVTPPKVVKTIPDFSEEIPTDTKEIRIVFSERMKTDRMDIGYPFLPVGRIRWDEDGKTLVIPIARKLEPLKTYTLILNSAGKHFMDLAGNQLEECILVFTTQGEPGKKPSVPIEKDRKTKSSVSEANTTPPTIVGTIPNFSMPFPLDTRKIKVIFSEKMESGWSMTSSLIREPFSWDKEGIVLTIPITEVLQPATTYTIVMNPEEGDRNFKDLSGNPLETCTLSFTTETTVIRITGMEKLDLSKDLLARVAANPAEGFYFPYYIFIPQSMDKSKPVHLLVEPCNTGTATDDFNIHDEKAKWLVKHSHANRIAMKLKAPLLVPVFPRPGGNEWRIYTHSLDRDTLLIKEGKLKRIDLQLIKMIEHAQALMRKNSVQVKEKIFMHGFSASGTFANRFPILHPTIVRAVAAGGVNGIPTFPTSHFPTDQWKDTAMRYPVGIADLKEIAGIDFDEAAYKQVSQYIYMGSLDSNDTIPFRDAYEEEDAELVKRLVGAKMMPDRWNVSQLIYKALDIPAQFVTYHDTGHEIRAEMIGDIVEFFEANSGDEIVQITPYQYAFEGSSAFEDKEDKMEFNLSAQTVTESGQHLARGNFPIRKINASLKFTSYFTQGTGAGDPVPMYMLFSYISNPTFELFRFPLTEGQSWTEVRSWDAEAQTTIEGYETIEVSAGVFPDTLKHKTVITGAKAESELQSALANGTRYLWFARGAGLVKMRYEHSNGVVTEAELIEYKIPDGGEEYMPLKVGNKWTYRWKNDYRDEAAIETVQVVPSEEEGGAVDIGPRTSLEKARYTVAITADEPRVAQVTCVLTPKEGSGEVIALHMNNNGADDLPNGYAYYLRDVTAKDAEGNSLPIEEIGKARWAIKPGDKSPVMLSYKALLEHDERDWGFGPDEAPYAKEDCIFWTGRALFIGSRIRQNSGVSNIELRFDVPENWHVSTPWQPIDGETHSFSVKDQDDLTESFVLLGTHCEHLAKSEDTEILLAIGGSFKESKDIIQNTVEGFLKAYTELFGGAPKSRMLLVANPYDRKGSMDGGVFGRSISLLMGDGLDEASRNRWAPFVGHEVFHVWNGQAISYSGQEYWFSEGFTNYYSEVISARLGLTSESDFLRRMERACKSYLSKVGQLSMRDAGSNKSLHYELVYEGGSLIGAILDLQICKLTDNEKNLDDAMKQMYREFGATGEKYTMQDVIRIVNEITGGDREGKAPAEPFKVFFSKYVSGRERLPLEEYFSYAGLDVKVEIGEELPSGDYVIHKMLHISSLTQTNEGLIIRRSQSAGYQDEDNLIAMNGTTVKTFLYRFRLASSRRCYTWKV